MSEKFYGVYWDKWELELDRGGHLTNPEVLHIVEFEYDEETDTVVSARRVTEKGEVIEDPWQALEYSDDLTHCGYDDSLTIPDALHWFELWLEQNRRWESLGGSRWEPEEWICTGIDFGD